MSFQVKLGRLPHLSDRASEACQQCRQLKRRCTKELPSCSLCTRLGKICDYSVQANVSTQDAQVLLARVQDLEERLEQAKSISGNGHDAQPNTTHVQNATSSAMYRPPPWINDRFPSNLYFLDAESFQKQSASVLDIGIPVPGHILHVLGEIDEVKSMCNAYFDTVDRCLPMLSKKRLTSRIESFNPEVDASLALLLLTMKLVTQILAVDEDPRSELYWTCRHFYTQTEEAPLISLALLQAKILIAQYEIGHGIYPAGFLSVAHAARLGHMMGLHERKKAPQLFKPPSTWTGREEERRVWWAALVLDRIAVHGVPGCKLTIGEPTDTELLPCEDSQWQNGAIGYNGQVHAPSLQGVELGRYAQVCQAAHILGRVLQHRAGQDLDKAFRLEEALQLEKTLTALDSVTQRPAATLGADCCDDAIAICCSARFLLYELYACNEHYDGSPTGREAQIQQLALQGIEQCVARMHQLALRLQQSLAIDYHKGSIMVTHALYWAASECRWYIREGKQEAVTVMETITSALRLLNNRWRRAGDYLNLLDREELESD